MKPLTANLQCFSRSWSFLIACLMLGVYLLMTLMVGPELGMSLWAALLAFFFGLVVSGVLRDVMSRPFSFVLPGHRRVVRWVLVLAGAVVVPLSGLLFLRALLASGRTAGWVVVAGTAVALAAYLAGVAIVFGTDLRTHDHSLMMYLFLLPLFLNLNGAVDAVLLPHPMWTLLAALAASALLLRWCSPERSVRRVCARLWAGPCSSRSKTMLERDRKEGLARKAEAAGAMPPPLESAFLSRLSRCQPATWAWNAWGEVYAILSRFRLTGALRALPGVLFVLAFYALWSQSVRVEPTPGAGASGPDQPFSFSFSIADWAVLFSPIVLLRFPSPIRSMVLPAGGRTERFRREVVTGAVLAVVTIASLVLAVALWEFFVRRIPPFAVAGMTFALRGPRAWAMLALPVMVPVFLASRLTVPRGESMAGGMIMSLGAVFLCACLFQAVAVLSVVFVPAAWALYLAFAWQVASCEDLP